MQGSVGGELRQCRMRSHTMSDSIGTAPDIAGMGVANPTAILMSGVMMLEHMGESAAARRIEAALHHVYRQGKHLTRDVGGTSATAEFTEAVIEALRDA